MRGARRPGHLCRLVHFAPPTVWYALYPEQFNHFFCSVLGFLLITLRSACCLVLSVPSNRPVTSPAQRPSHSVRRAHRAVPRRPLSTAGHCSRHPLGLPARPPTGRAASVAPAAPARQNRPRGSRVAQDFRYFRYRRLQGRVLQSRLMWGPCAAPSRFRTCQTDIGGGVIESERGNTAEAMRLQTR